MLKLILIFRRLLQPQAFLVLRNRFLSAETTTIYLFFQDHPVEKRLEQRHFLKKSYACGTWSFYISPVEQKIHRRWVNNVEVIDCKKLDIENEDFLFMRHFCGLMFWNKIDYKKMWNCFSFVFFSGNQFF